MLVTRPYHSTHFGYSKRIELLAGAWYSRQVTASSPIDELPNAWRHSANRCGGSRYQGSPLRQSCKALRPSILSAMQRPNGDKFRAGQLQCAPHRAACLFPGNYRGTMIRTTHLVAWQVGRVARWLSLGRRLTGQLEIPSSCCYRRSVGRSVGLWRTSQTRTRPKDSNQRFPGFTTPFAFPMPFLAPSPHA